MRRGAEPEHVGGALGRDPLQRRAQHRDAKLGRERRREQRAEELERRSAHRQRLLPTAHVGDDEHVEHHDGARVHDHLGGGDELGPQQQEQGRQRDQVEDQREHAVERVAQRDDADRAGQRTDRGQEEEDRFAVHGRIAPPPRITPPPRASGVRSIGSANNISLVKIRSERV